MNKPLLFITFNRLDYVQKTFEQIKIAKPPRFYIASDGPREHIEGEKEKIQEVRDYILSNIDWECEIKTRFLDKNSGGCAHGVSEAVTWFFENEEDGIILEDDCVPSQSFFRFCEELLDKYKDDKRIWHITGNNYLDYFECKDDYFFSRIMCGAAWAGWADRWKHYQFDVDFSALKDLSFFSKRKSVQEFWRDKCKILSTQNIDAWDYQWAMKIMQQGGLCIFPSKNLITNIGISGTHFESSYIPSFLLRERYELDIKKHPKKVKESLRATNEYYARVLSIKKVKNPWTILWILFLRCFLY